MMKSSTCLAGKDVSVGCVFGADEELGGFTTTWMVEEKECRPRRMVIVVDSAYAKIGYATKGQLVVKATLKDECIQLPTINYQLPTKRTLQCYAHLFLRRR